MNKLPAFLVIPALPIWALTAGDHGAHGVEGAPYTQVRSASPDIQTKSLS